MISGGAIVQPICGIAIAELIMQQFTEIKQKG